MKTIVARGLVVIIAFVFTSFNELKTGADLNNTAFIIELEGRYEIPPVKTDARGVALIRVTSDMQLHTRIMVHRLNQNDGQLISAYIHSGAAGANGPALVVIAATPADFDKNVAQPLTNAQYESLLNDPIYVNVVTSTRPAGLIRGQVR